MVAKISTGGNMFGALAYNQNKVDSEEAKVLFSNRMLLSEDGNFSIGGCMRSFEMQMPVQLSTKKPIIHISINPHPEDVLTDQQLSDIAKEYMRKLGYGDQPYLVYKHTDIDRYHIHIVGLRVDENGKPVEIRFRERGESEKLIEEFMLQANEAVAEYMCKRELPTVYRVHENPDPDKLRVFASFARPFGYRIDPSKPEDTAQFQTVLRGAKNDPKQRVLPTLLLRSLARARYADECIGHYGLKAKFYLHFTSPIRRYPDLVAHRMLQKALLGEEFTAADETMCEEAADQSTNREQAADNCERDIDKLYIASYMQQFIGEEFDAEVSGVQSFGVFVALENGCEGLIRAELMTGDFYQYDEEHMAMVGRHTGKRFTIGTPMRVKLLAASDTTGQIDFAPADGSLPVSEKLDRPRREDTDRAPRGNRAERRRHSGKGRGGKPGKGKKPPTRKRR